MADTRRLRRVKAGRRERTDNIYQRVRIRDGKEQPLPAGRKTAYVVVVTQDGKQYRRYARTLAEAINVRNDLEDLLRGGSDLDRANRSFADYADTWIASYTGKNDNLRDETKAEYEKEIELAKAYFKQKRKADKPMRLLTAEDAKAYRDHVRRTRGRNGQPAAVGTLRNAIAPLRAMFFDALADGAVERNPFSKLALGEKPKQREPGAAREEVETRKAFSNAELRRVLEELGKPTLRKGQQAPDEWTPGYWPLMGEFLAHTGLRISEAIALRWEDLDLDARRVYVRFRIYKRVESDPKSRHAAHPNRKITLTVGMAAKLRELRRAATFNKGGDPVFPAANGKPLDPSNIYKRVFKPAFERAGVGWAGFHTFRHTCASLLLTKSGRREDGEPITTHASLLQAQHFLGHHSGAFTLSVYGHLLPGDDADVAFFDEITDGSRNGSSRNPKKAKARKSGSAA